MCYINLQLPEFKVNAYRKDKGFIQVSNEDLKGKWSILFFYPGDFTFVCPTELADLADHYAEFQALGVDIYSVSTDSHFVHKAWADATETIRKIEYTMLADMTSELSAALGVLGEESGQAYRWYLPLQPRWRAEDPLRSTTTVSVVTQANSSGKVKAAKFVYEHPGQVCPAKWKEGDATLTPSIDLVGKL